jgi:GAF domain-containing protein/HAMP domain-containing protein
MNMSQLPIQAAPETKDPYARNGYFILVVLMFAAFITASLFAYAGYINNYPQLYIITATLIATLLTDLWLLSLIRAGRTTYAMMLVITFFLLNVLIVPFFVQGLGPIIAVAAIIVTIAVTGLAMSPQYAPSGMVVGVFAGVLLFFLDFLLGSNRISIPQLTAYTPFVVIFISVLILLLVTREFKSFSLRIKIALGVLLTGALTVTALTLFGFSRINSVVDTLTGIFEQSARERTEAALQTAIQTQTTQANDFFLKTLSDLNSLAEYRANLEAQQATLGLGTYWNANDKLFRLPNGTYGNQPADIASIYIPSDYRVDEAMLSDLNTTAYLDFIAPGFLKSHPKVVALYYISALGSTTYYPNISLAQSIPAGFNPLTQTFFTIAAPDRNPQHLPRWTPAYQDPAGTGLIVTLSIPVYTSNGIFKGVISADLQITEIVKELANFKFGESGFAFLLDNKGHILDAPLAGYAFLGLQREEIPLNESPKQSMVGIGSEKLKSLTQRIISGESGLIKENIDGTDIYIGFAPLETPGYRYAIFTPADELNQSIVVDRGEARKELAATLQGVSVLLAGLFVVAFFVSLGIGQVITIPLLRLTKTVEQIAAGDLSARANAEALDETGKLARAFNSMTEKLNETLFNLERRVLDRTSELEKANARNAHRAAQFESLALVARTISSTQTLDALLTHITETISAQFKFYHVGIFLLDSHREYAILVAANSEGGKRMLERNHRLRVGETGIVGFVTNTGQPRVAMDVGKDTTYFNNPDLPNTHSEMALPLRIGMDSFGALDVQSTEVNSFSEEDVSVLSILADQVSIAIQNSRSYQQSREALAQAEVTSQQLLGQQWKGFIEHQTVQGYYFDGIATKQLTEADKTRSHNLAIPLTLRGTRIGNIKLSALNPDHEWTDDEISVVQAAAERTSLALESARLLQESQKRASKERTIGEISAKIGGSVNLENILQTAIQELGNALPGTDVAIQFTETKIER